MCNWSTAKVKILFFSAGIVIIRQNLTSTFVRVRRVKTVPVLKVLLITILADHSGLSRIERVKNPSQCIISKQDIFNSMDYIIFREITCDDRITCSEYSCHFSHSDVGG